jgi:hypothetical protein
MFMFLTSDPSHNSLTLVTHGRHGIVVCNSLCAVLCTLRALRHLTVACSTISRPENILEIKTKNFFENTDKI